MKPRRLVSRITAAAASVLAMASATALATGSNQPPHGTVYAMSNASTGNAVLAFNRRADGRLDPADSFPTGGFGTGGSLGNQSSLVLHPNHLWLFAVNAGSGQITVLGARRRAAVAVRRPLHPGPGHGASDQYRRP